MNWPNWIKDHPQSTSKGAGNLYEVVRFRQALERERARADRWEQRLSMLSFGVKRSAAGDETLKLIARRLRSRLRATDEAGWLDGRHIGILMPNTEAVGAWTLADEICSSLPHTAELPECRVFIYPSQWFAGDRNDGELTHDGRIRDGFDGDGSQTEAMEPLFFQRLPPWKRAIDFVVAGLALVILSPLLAIVAVSIKLTSRGPAMFVQKRSGLGGRPFVIYKFRTMVIDAEQRKAELRAFSEQDGPAFKMKNDPRVIPLGSWLRKTSIDELPQLFNVLCGDMSLVGPRPLPCAETADCRGWHRRRLDVTPGITCLWQVSGRSRVTFEEWMRMDARYVGSRSFWHDLTLILKTLPAVLFRRGAV